MRWNKKWNKSVTIAAAVVGSILILWSGKSEQPPSGWEPMQLGAEKPTSEQKPSAVQSANSVKDHTEAPAGAAGTKKTPNVTSEGAGETQVFSDRGTSGAPVVQKTDQTRGRQEVSAEQTQSTVLENKSDEGKIDVNLASVSELTKLPGIGQKKAQAIVDYRSTHGPFGKVSDLTKVKGIGVKMLQKMAPYVQIR